jgi:DNA-binding NtrC family response regulator
MILVLGTDDALLEGLAQALSASGQPVAVAKTIDEVEELTARTAPLLLIADRARLASAGGARLARLAVAAGGSLVAYRGSGEDDTVFALPAEVARIALADLELPLERNRLVAIAVYAAARAREVGRPGRRTPPPESPPESPAT